MDTTKAKSPTKKSILTSTIGERFHAPPMPGTVVHHEVRLRSTRAVEAMNRMFEVYDPFHN